MFVNCYSSTLAAGKQIFAVRVTSRRAFSTVSSTSCGKIDVDRIILVNYAVQRQHSDCPIATLRFKSQHPAHIRLWGLDLQPARPAVVEIPSAPVACHRSSRERERARARAFSLKHIVAGVSSNNGIISGGNNFCVALGISHRFDSLPAVSALNIIVARPRSPRPPQ